MIIIFIIDFLKKSWLPFSSKKKKKLKEVYQLTFLMQYKILAL